MDELQEIITDTMKAIPKAKLIHVLQAWRRPLAQCVQHKETPFINSAGRHTETHWAV
jgi:hypothetical protein